MKNYAHIALSYITTFYFNKNNASSFAEYLDGYCRFSSQLLDRIQFVLIDDGSPNPPTIPSQLPLNLLLLRINKDIPWNMSGGRNLGVTFARSEKIVLTDWDHFFPEKTLQKLIQMPAPRKTIYTFPRKTEKGEWCGEHFNTFFMTRSRFFRYYGYDEAFAGHYGYEDDFFRRFQSFHGTAFKNLGSRYFIQRRHTDISQSQHSLVRDKSVNHEFYMHKRNLLDNYGPGAGHSRMYLNFPWQVICDLQRFPESYSLQRRPWWPRLRRLRSYLPCT